MLIPLLLFLDEVKDADQRLAASRSAASGLERLDAFVAAWGNYIPEIYGVARALIALQNSDDAARAAWADRTGAVRHGCKAAVAALKKDGKLCHYLSMKEATDLLWCQLSVETWEHLRQRCGWSQARYLHVMQHVARETLTV